MGGPRKLFGSAQYCGIKTKCGKEVRFHLLHLSLSLSRSLIFTSFTQRYYSSTQESTEQSNQSKKAEPSIAKHCQPTVQKREGAIIFVSNRLDRTQIIARSHNKTLDSTSIDKIPISVRGIADL
jgi:hypothetical protein